jgi:predicted NAD/FAD-binding protein
VVIATHAPQALAMLADASASERALLGALRTAPNRVVLHRDPRLMPRRRAAWASWNYLSRPDGALCVTYWMDRLQALPSAHGQHFVTLNPVREPRDILHEESFDHPRFDAAAIRAQRALWTLQGTRHTWYCGAWFGSGFHEDGLQAGLAVAEQLGGVRRPWQVQGASARIHLPPVAVPAA